MNMIKHLIFLLVICCNAHHSFAFLSFGNWTEVQYLNSSLISPRSGHCGAYFPQTNEYVLFSGTLGGGAFLNDMYLINLTSLQCRQESGLPARLHKWAFAAHVSDPRTGDLYIHTGAADNVGAYNDDFWKWNVQSRNWTQLRSGSPVTSRTRHCLLLDETFNRLVIFGGYNAIDYYNDIWIYNITNDTWTAETPVQNSSSPLPAARYNFGSTLISATSGSSLYIQGGFLQDATSAQDFWQYSFAMKNWTLLDSGNSDVQLDGHALFYLKQYNSFFIFLGRKFQGLTVTSNVYQYSLSNTIANWTLVPINSQIPARRIFSTGFNDFTNELFVFGGFKNSNARLNDFWKLQVADPISIPSPRSTTIDTTTASTTTRSTTDGLRATTAETTTSLIPNSVTTTFEDKTTNTPMESFNATKSQHENKTTGSLTVNPLPTTFLKSSVSQSETSQSSLSAGLTVFGVFAVLGIIMLIRFIGVGNLNR